MIVDHIGIGVGDYERAKALYGRALAPLGLSLMMEETPDQSEGGVWAAGCGRDGRPDFWIGSDGRTTPPAHIAFIARSRDEVHAFHEAALAAGAADNGAPGPRPHYGERYYAAFVLDPDGHNIEAVCRAPD